MTEYRYLNCFGDASDAVMNFIGCDKDYINKGNSYFTVETNIRHLKEIKVGEEEFQIGNELNETILEKIIAIDIH